MTTPASDLRPEYANHVWSYDFVEDRTHDDRKVRMLNIIDEYTRACLAIRVSQKLKAVDVIDVLSDLFMRGVPVQFGLTTGPSSWPKPCASGLRLWVPRRLTSNRAARGRTAIVKASTRSFGMSCWKGKSAPPCMKQR